MNKTDREETNTVHTIEDVTGRLSNLVRLMDENSKIIQPSDLTVQSYESQSVSAYNNPNNIYGLAEEHEGIDFQQRVSSLEKLNSFLANNNRGLDSSMEQTQALLEDLLKDEDSKFIKQLDDLRHCTLAKQLHRVK